jgi:hypothetical protein
MAIQSFELCDQSGVFVNVNDNGTPLVTGDTYSVINVSGSTIPGPVYELATLFDSCFACSSSIPFSAGTEYNGCVICCPCGPGTTVNEVTLPHPEWTGLYGNPITQLGSVQLGGRNGLNS